MIDLLPLDEPAAFELAAAWLGRPENYQWLDFGRGVQRLSAANLKIMSQREIHDLRLFTADDHQPIGLVGLSNIDRRFGTGEPWLVLGEKAYAGQGYGSRAMSKIVGVGFHEVGLQALNAWTLENNMAGIRVLRGIGFRSAGRLRRCHQIDGRWLDRLLFDLLAEEYREHEEN